MSTIVQLVAVASGCTLLVGRQEAQAADDFVKGFLGLSAVLGSGLNESAP